MPLPMACPRVISLAAWPRTAAAQPPPEDAERSGVACRAHNLRPQPAVGPLRHDGVHSTQLPLHVALQEGKQTLPGVGGRSGRAGGAWDGFAAGMRAAASAA